jgi:hypothetical protein
MPFLPADLLSNIAKPYHSLHRRAGENPINVWFPFMNSQKCNCYFQNRIIMFSLPVPTLMYCERFIYFQDQTAYSAAGKYMD